MAATQARDERGERGEPARSPTNELPPAAFDFATVRDGVAPGIGRHILVVDGDADDRRRISRTLEFQGFAVTTVSRIDHGREVLDPGRVDLVVFDPAADGEWPETVVRLRQELHLPVIVVSHGAAEGDRVMALTLGADDYLVKPLSTLELAARVLAVLRRYDDRGSRVDILSFGDIEIDRTAHEVRVHGHRVELTPKEYDLLVTLAGRPGRSCGRDELLGRVWGSSAEFQDPATVTEHVRRLRKKLGEDAESPRHLVTVRGAGYRWEP